MKRKEVLELLRITAPTLSRYVKKRLITITTLGNGRYDYDDASVYAFLNKNVQRKVAVYARVSTTKQRKDLENQTELLKNYCFQNGLQINSVYSDIASGISFEKRKDFFKLLDEIIARKVDKVVISYKDRLSRVGFGLFKHLFLKFGTEIVVISEVGSERLDSKEVFEEIVSLLHCYSMKLYSNRKKQIIETLIQPEDNNIAKS